jgi:hypothetical protein
MNNRTPETTPVKRSYINYNNNNRFLDNLIQNIPILENTNLLESIFEYCNLLHTYHSSNKESYIRFGIIDKINNILKNIKNNYIKTNSIKTNNENNDIIKIENKIIKKHSLKADGLIESIINNIVYYCSSDSTVKSNLSISTNNKFYQIMNYAEGISLGEFIIELYNSNNIINKDLFLLNILKEVAIKLNYLQNSCGFIHGDLHSGNIFINYSSNNRIDITFIDFGYSTIKFPNTDFLISGVTDVNLQSKYQFDLNIDEYLKSVDLFHLIENLVSFKLMINETEKYKFKTFFNLINNIRMKYLLDFNIKLFSNYRSIHFITSSNIFQDNRFNILMPDEFIELIDNDIIININEYTKNINESSNNNSNQKSIKRRGLFSNNNNNNNNLNIKSTKKKGLFTNNSNNSNNNNNNNLNIKSTKKKGLFSNNNNL